jgi:hypothetical protein
VRFCVTFLPESSVDGEKMMKMPVLGTDSLTVAVRVRPFSQVSAKCYTALSKT